MCSKRKIGTILRLNNESFEDEELSYETVEIGNGFANSMSTVMKQSRNLTKKSCQIRKKNSFISNENMNNIIKIIKSLEHS